MAKRKGGGKRKGGSCAGLLAALVIVLLFGCALFLLTTDNPGGMTGERQGRPSLPGTGNIQNRKGSPAPEPHTQKEPSPVKKREGPRTANTYRYCFAYSIASPTEGESLP
jgi:hypothetical protein